MHPSRTQEKPINLFNYSFQKLIKTEKKKHRKSKRKDLNILILRRSLASISNSIPLVSSRHFIPISQSGGLKNAKRVDLSGQEDGASGWQVEGRRGWGGREATKIPRHGRPTTSSFDFSRTTIDSWKLSSGFISFLARFSSFPTT